MPTTSNKGYEIQVTGTNPGSWGSVLNDDVIEIIDKNLGNTTEKSLTNAPVVLSATESQSLILRLTGTLTGNVQITTSAIGMTIIENLCVVGAFSVTFTDGVGAVTLPPLARSIVVTGAAAGARVVANNFPSGTRMLFQQTTAPTGWTKESSSTYNNSALRIVTGSVSTGGSVDFTNAFATQPVTGTVGGTTITISQMPAHTHDNIQLGNNNNDNIGIPSASAGGIGLSFNTSSAGGGQSHTHSFVGTAINLAVKFADCIIGIKD